MEATVPSSSAWAAHTNRQPSKAFTDTRLHYRSRPVRHRRQLCRGRFRLNHYQTLAQHHHLTPENPLIFPALADTSGLYRC